MLHTDRTGQTEQQVADLTWPWHTNKLGKTEQKNCWLDLFTNSIIKVKVLVISYILLFDNFLKKYSTLLKRVTSTFIWTSLNKISTFPFICIDEQCTNEIQWQDRFKFTCDHNLSSRCMRCIVVTLFVSQFVY